MAAELNISETDLVSPWHAALAFTVGAILPLLAILLIPEPWRISSTFAVVLVALAITGTLAAALGGSSKRRAAIRIVVGGALALAATYGIGLLLSASGIVG